ncbi:alginate lyase family protein [Blastopirellula marina]|uniref:Uncharacterized protein n=1 Tax=Blastopirellula marina TaxID=124 RepID=A0A2S8G0V2_9BACT|nr:alginate lyase family protein [Blastopirellula marina]PQO38063.1 hypothetical protein C5Y98_08235 [Blastopirellula marina]PTL44719.1 hypothetical protein C5Y97_08235 [Blastopirellula marina]
MNDSGSSKIAQEAVHQDTIPGIASGGVAVPASLEDQADHFVHELVALKRPTKRSNRFEKLERWWYVLRYHRKSQLLRRLGKVIKQRLPRLGRSAVPKLAGHEELPIREGVDWQAFLNRQMNRNAAHDDSAIERMKLRTFRFLNHEIAFGSEIDWRMVHHQGVPHLWRFHLHYHEFLLAFIRNANHESAEWAAPAWDIINDWIIHNQQENASCRNDAWHPFCISRRLPVWCLLWNYGTPCKELQPVILESIYSQAVALEKNLEKDLGGNHLLENARGLAFAGAFLDGREGDRLLELAAKILRDELPQQILPHGEHFELSPMYHGIMLSGILDVRDLTKTIDPAFSANCHDAAKQMANFLKYVGHPDDAIPLLGDSAFGESPAKSELVSRVASGTETKSYEKESSKPALLGPYWTWRDGQNFVLFDTGACAPDDLPAHGHSDLLTLEASLGGQRLITDSGVFNYEESAMRQYCRSTRAHNVLQIDDEEQCDVWSRFRMGRRGKTSSLKTGTTHGFHWGAATHNAYRHLGVPEVGRLLACRPDGPWIILDWAKGRGSHTCMNRLHLGPEVTTGAVEGKQIELQLPGESASLSLLGMGQLSLAASWYCPEFGNRIARPMVEACYEGNLPYVAGWCIQGTKCAQQVDLNIDSDGAPVLLIANGDHNACWRPFDEL